MKALGGWNLKGKGVGILLVVQWLRHHDSTAEGTGSIPSRATKIPSAPCHSQKIERKKKVRGLNVIDQLDGFDTKLFLCVSTGA